MKPFPGFPPNIQFAGLPKLFFSELLPYIDDIAELKITIHLLQTLYQKRGYPKFVTHGELLGDKTLMKGIGEGEALRHGLEHAISRGTIIRLTLERDGKLEELYFLNTEGDREACARIERGEIDLGALPRKEPYAQTGEQPNIFTLYEENIGMLTPMIAEELKDAERLYPASWIEEAFKEAVSRNRRHWKYIEAILKRWDSEGKEHGAPGRDSKEDPEKYFKGRYGHLVKRRID